MKKLFIYFATIAFLISIPLVANGKIRPRNIDDVFDDEPFTMMDVTVSDDLIVTDDTTLTDDVTIGGDLAVTGSITGASSTATITALDVTNNATVGGDLDVTGTITGTYSPASYAVTDDDTITFGTNTDYSLEYDENGQDIFILATDAATSQNDEQAMITFAVNTSSGSGVDADQEVFEIGKDGTDDSDSNWIELLAVDEDGDVSCAATITPGTNLVIADDNDVVLGTNSDYVVEYDEDGQDILRIATAGTTTQADEQAMVTIAVDTANNTMDADQEVFEIGKNDVDDSGGNWTELLAVDEDGDVTIAGDVVANSFSGSISVEDIDLGDDLTADYGDSDEWKMEYADGDEDTLSIYSSKVGTSGTDNAMVTIAADTGNAGCTANQEVFEIGKGDQDDADTNFVELLAVDEDGDLSIAGDLAMLDGKVIKFGTNTDWEIDYDESGQDILAIVSTNTTTQNDEQAMVTIAVDSGNNTMDADQEVFEIGKGDVDDSGGNWTELLAVDEDGDVSITSDLTVTGNDIIFGNAEEVQNTTDDMIEFIGSGGADDTDLRIDLDGTHPVLSSPTDAVIEIAEPVTISGATELTLQNGEIIKNSTDDMVELVGGSGADDTDLRIDLDGTHPVLSSPTDGTIEIGEILDVTGGVVVLANDEEIQNSTDDMVEFQGAGGGDNTDLRIDLDGALPVLTSPTDNNIGVEGGYLKIGNAGTVTIADGDGDLYVEDECEVDGDATVGGTLGVTGNSTLSGTLAVTGKATFNGAVTIYQRTEAQLKALSPAAAGDLYMDTTNSYQVLVATGTGAGDFADISDGTTPTGW